MPNYSLRLYWVYFIQELKVLVASFSLFWVFMKMLLVWWKNYILALICISLSTIEVEKSYWPFVFFWLNNLFMFFAHFPLATLLFKIDLWGFVTYWGLNYLKNFIINLSCRDSQWKMRPQTQVGNPVTFFLYWIWGDWKPHGHNLKSDCILAAV